MYFNLRVIDLLSFSRKYLIIKLDKLNLDLKPPKCTYE